MPEVSPNIFDNLCNEREREGERDNFSVKKEIIYKKNELNPQ